jgi:predicted  nucleic acid-binding Zn-ribbon protein
MNPPAFAVPLNPAEENAMSKKDEYVAKMKKQLDDWNTSIDELQVKASLAKAELKAKYEQQIADLRRKKQEGDQKLSAIKAAADDSWETLKGEAERTWNAFKGAVEEFKSRMK